MLILNCNRLKIPHHKQSSAYLEDRHIDFIQAQSWLPSTNVGFLAVRLMIRSGISSCPGVWTSDKVEG
jgi:hypothetical protein